MNNIHIEKIQAKEFEEVALILTNAFETNPAYALIFNHTNKLREGLLWLFQTNLYLLNRKKTVTSVIKDNNSNSIIGTFSVVPPEGGENSFSDYCHIGLPKFILKFGIRAFSKLLGMSKLNKNILKNSIRETTYYYLSMVAVKDELQGKGIGSFAINTCLKELSKIENNCCLIGLTTQMSENVRFYSLLGFEKINESQVSYRGNRYHNWNMKYIWEFKKT